MFLVSGVDYPASDPIMISTMYQNIKSEFSTPYRQAVENACYRGRYPSILIALQDRTHSPHVDECTDDSPDSRTAAGYISSSQSSLSLRARAQL
jgi:hypothetical protein